MASTIRFVLDRIAQENARNLHVDSRERVYRIFNPAAISFRLRMVKSDNGAAKDRPMRAVFEPEEPLKRFLEEVELNRIKRCAYEKCRQIFWAGRTDRPCCSEPCRNSYRQKKHRDRVASAESVERQKAPAGEGAKVGVCGTVVGAAARNV